MCGFAAEGHGVDPILTGCPTGRPFPGCDIGVQEFLETKTEMPQFLELVKNIVSINIDNYLGRNFEHLQINFGCTGGQHRSVYCAEKTAAFIREKYPQATVTIQHDEQPQLNNH